MKVRKNIWLKEKGNIYYFTNGRYIDCLSLTYATNKSKTYKKKKNYYTLKTKKHKKENIQGKHKVLMLRGSHKNSDNKITKSIFHHFCTSFPVSLTFRLIS